MSKYIIEIEDTPAGLHFKAGGFEEFDGSAGELYIVLTMTAEIYLATINMDIPQTLAYVKAQTDKRTEHWGGNHEL